MNQHSPGLAPSHSDRLAEFKTAIYGRYHATHATYSAERGSEVPAGSVAHIRHFLKLGLPADRTTPILDLGCGGGALLGIAQEMGYSDLAGVDVAAGMLDKARTRSLARLHQGDVLEFLRAQPAGTFGVVTAVDLLEHLQRPELLDLCREVGRVLRPGGVFLIHSPNGASPLVGHILHGDITHEVAFTRTSLGQLLLTVGFEPPVCLEEAPVIRNLTSLVRAALWQVVRSATVFRLAVETGVLRGHVLTVNLIAIARKPG